MATTFSFESSIAAFGTARTGRVRPAPRTGPYKAFTPPARHAGETAAAKGAPAALMPSLAVRFGPARFQWVDALVTIAVMGWLIVALARMAGEA